MKKLHYTGTLSPGLQFFFIQKRCHFLSLGMALVMFILLSVWGAIFFRQSYQHHMDDISGQWLSLWVVLSGNAHIVANSPIFFWDVIGSEWVIAIEF